MAKYYPDISHYHPVQNWAEVKKHCPFIISKATQGTSYIDPTLTRFIAECENRKIPYWLYTYLNKGNELAQAQFLVRVLDQRINKKSKNFMGYILDVEAGSTAAGVKSALSWLNAQGKKTMIYTMYSEYSRYKDVISTRGANCAWWEARYGKNNGLDTSASNPCHAGVDLHQYTSKGYVPGIGSGIDLNKLMNKPLSWFITQSTAPDKSPTGTTLELAYNTMSGAYGTGDDRKKILANRYQEVQDFINHIANSTTETLAKEVLQGKYGTGDVRKTVLGTKYKAVQDKVNSML